VQDLSACTLAKQARKKPCLADTRLQGIRLIHSQRPPAGEASQEQLPERAAGRAAAAARGLAQAQAQPGLAAAAQEHAQVAARLGAQRVFQAAQVDLRARGRPRRLAPSKQSRFGGRKIVIRLRPWYSFVERERS